MARDKSRQRKLQRKNQKRREQLRRIAANSGLPSGAARDFDEAEYLIAQGDSEEAIPILKDLAARYPRRIEILLCLADAHRRTNDLWSYQAVCERIVAVAPNAPELWLALGSAALTNTQIATAHRAFAHVAATWPDDADAEQTQKMLETLKALLVEECRRRGMDEATGDQVLHLHDEINLHLQCGLYEKVFELARRLLAICPTFAPALNNRGQAHFQLAQYDEAIADCRRVLQFDATNYHALANLTRYLFLSGRFEEAKIAAASLKQCDARDDDAFLKKAEAFAILGDWEPVRQAVDDGQCTWTEHGGMPALAEHLLAVALANLGDLKEARRHWKHASAAIDWAKDNLEDSTRPVGERHGPWAFPLDSWVPRGVFEKLLRALEGARRPGEQNRIVQRHFERYPQIELLAEPMLQHSDPLACETLIRVAELVNRPALFAALKAFALGQRGSDDLRAKALMTLSKAGYVEGQVELWREGSPRPISLLSQEIHSEPTTVPPPAINELMVSAHRAITDGRGADAERLLDEVLRLCPDDVSARYNRAMAIGVQGRDDEANKIIRQIHRDFPDYGFARTHLATMCIADGDLDQAAKLLAPIAQKKRLHTTEYAAWCSASIQLAIARADLKSARGLVSAWEQIAPGDPRIKLWKKRIDGTDGMVGRLARIFKVPQRAED